MGLERRFRCGLSWLGKTGLRAPIILQSSPPGHTPGMKRNLLQLSLAALTPARAATADVLDAVVCPHPPPRRCTP